MALAFDRNFKLEFCLENFPVGSNGCLSLWQLSSAFLDLQIFRCVKRAYKFTKSSSNGGKMFSFRRFTTSLLCVKYSTHFLVYVTELWSYIRDWLPQMKWNSTRRCCWWPGVLQSEISARRITLISSLSLPLSLFLSFAYNHSPFQTDRLARFILLQFPATLGCYRSTQTFPNAKSVGMTHCLGVLMMRLARISL